MSEEKLREISKIAGCEARAVPSADRYAVTEDGRIFSFGTRYPMREMKLDLNGGYYRFTPMVAGKKIVKKVHHAVLEAFHGDPPTQQHVCRHLDGNRTNNHRTNLAWGTHQENSDDMIRHGTRKRGPEARCNSKLTEDEVVAIKGMLTRFTDREIADKYGVHRRTISDIRRKKTWWYIDPPEKREQRNTR